MQIPQIDERPPASVWAPGDVPHSWDELAAEGAQPSAPANGQQDQIIAAKDVEIARLQAELAAANAPVAETVPGA
jgi:hypothetical protein